MMSNKRGQLTLKMIFGILAGIGAIVIIFKAMSGDFAGAITDWANSQIPFWVTLPTGVIVVGFIVYSLFRNQIDGFINNFDLSGGRI